MMLLDRIVESKREEVAGLASKRLALRARAEGEVREARPPRGLAAALRREAEVALLAEVKRRSPSAGWIREGARVEEVAECYADAGASALSVLTDGPFFGGSLEDLSRARGAVPVPVLRKDFLLDPLQVWESRAAGADGVLLIVRLLDDALLADLHILGRELGMDVLVEVHDARELERALRVEPALLGVNHRDLSTFEMHEALAVELAPLVPREVVLVAESGIASAAAVDRQGEAGIDAVLVGESLMRAPDVRAAAASLVGRPRARRNSG